MLFNISIFKESFLTIEEVASSRRERAELLNRVFSKRDFILATPSWVFFQELRYMKEFYDKKEKENGLWL